MEDRPRISLILNSLANYSNTIPAPADPDAKPAAGGARMGTLIGVYLPCIQNIFGVILFIRLTWVVGTAGAIAGFLIVFCCCSVVTWFVIKKKKKTNLSFGLRFERTWGRSKTLFDGLEFLDDAHSYINECDRYERSGAWRRVLLHDIQVFGTRVWRGCRNAVLHGHHSGRCHVHYRCRWNCDSKCWSNSSVDLTKNPASV